MREPVLVILAAGMGSRYGGLKQMDPVDKEGNAIIDFSIYDAKRAGFKKVVFVIKKAIEKDFKEVIGKHIEEQMEVSYVFQELDAKLPEGIKIPEGRVKPWGTGHAILCVEDVVDGPFAVINADDYYGVKGFQIIYNWLKENQDGEKYQYAMMGYHVENTITENGHVSRGVCTTDENGHLVDIHERTRIEKHGDCAAYTEDDGETWIEIPNGTPVSMNLWGYNESILRELKERFPAFLEKTLKENPLKGEFFIPFVTDELLKEGKAEVTVLESDDKWYGVTYKEDKPQVMEALQSLKDKGLYPQGVWRE